MKIKNKYHQLWQCMHYYRPYRGFILLLITVMLLASSLGMLLPWVISQRLVGISDGRMKDVVHYSIIILIIIVFHHLFWYLWEKLGSVLTNRVALDIRRDIMRSFLDTEYATLKTKTSGYFLERMNDDTNGVASFLTYILGIIVDCLTNFSFIILIWFLNWRCGTLFTSGIMFIYLIELIRIRFDLKYTEQIKLTSEKLNSKINENFRGIRDIKELGLKESAFQATDHFSAVLSNLQIRKDNITALLSRCKTFTQHLIEGLLFIYAALVLFPREQITTVILLTIVNYSGFMYDLIGYIAQIKDLLVKGDFRAGRILSITAKAPKEQFGTMSLQTDGTLTVSHLSYAYEDGRTVLDDISFSVAQHTTAVLTGASGSGKSTLFSLLLGLMPAPCDTIKIGGTDIRQLSEQTLRDTICIVNQDIFLINDTILNNLRLVRPQSSDKEIENACRCAHIYDEIIRLENGFDTVIQENGSNLSGGQKQRISIARAILKDAPILLLDEPTSAMDAENQQLLLQTLFELKKRKTILMVAHKLTDFTGFDLVISLENGSVSSYHPEEI